VSNKGVNKQLTNIVIVYAGLLIGTLRFGIKISLFALYIL